MEKRKRLIARGFILGLLAGILSAGIALAGPPFDPGTTEGGLPQCKADLATCNTNLTQTQANYGVCLNDLQGCIADFSTSKADLATCNTDLTQTQAEHDVCLNDLQSCTADLSACEADLTPTPRFTDNLNGTVTDNLTGLIWTQNAGLFLWVSWNTAADSCNRLAGGSDGLNDGSNPGDWRLPNIRELQSLIDFGNHNPALPAGHPFLYVSLGNNRYWSSTIYKFNSSYAWTSSLTTGDTVTSLRTSTTYFVAWCVRGGQ